MALTPLPFQLHDVETLARNNFTALIRSQPGGMKTMTAVLAMQRADADVNLVIAPLGTHRSAWLPTFQDRGIDARVVGNAGKAQKQALADLEWGVKGTYVMTPQLFTRMDVSTLTPDFLTVDEAHVLSQPKSKGQRNLSGYYHDKGISAGARLALSGTPFRRSFERAWSLTRFLWPELEDAGQIAYKNFYAWRNQRMEWQKDYFSPDGRKYIGEKNPGQLVSEMPCYIFHAKRENCCQFHPNGFLPLEEPQLLEREVILLPEQKKAKQTLEESYIAWLGNNPMVVDLPVTLQIRLRQVALGVPSVSAEGEVTFDLDCKSPIMDEAIDIMHSLGDENAVVYTSSQQFARVAVHQFQQAGISAGEFSGANVKVREDNLERFGTDLRVLVVTLASGSTGLDSIQKKCSTEIWLDEHVDDVLTEQAESRADRYGAAKQVQRFRLYDDVGVTRGIVSKNLVQRLAMNRSLRVAS